MDGTYPTKWMQDYYRGHWEFLKLFISLTTASFGGWFLAQDKLVFDRMSGIFFDLVLGCLGAAILQTLSTIRLLIVIEQQHLVLHETTTPEGRLVLDEKAPPRLRQYYGALRLCTLMFGAAVGLAAVCIFLSLWQKDLPWFK